MTFITTILKLNMGIRAKLLFTAIDSLAYEIRTKDFYKYINPDIEKLLTQATTPLIILLKLKQDLIVKCLKCLRMKLVESRLLIFFV